MEQIKRDEFIELLYTKCACYDILSYADDLLDIAQNSEEYKEIIDELSETWEDYIVKDALERNFLKIVSKIKEEENHSLFDTLKIYDILGDSFFEGWRDEEVQEIFDELKIESRKRLRYLYTDDALLKLRTNN